jgi:proline dehydrogenase
MLRPLLLNMSKSPSWKRRISSWRIARPMVTRFIAGDDLDAAVKVAHSLCAEGLALTMDHLGEAVNDPGEADNAAREYEILLRRIAAEGLRSSISVKPTQLGLDVDLQRCGQRILSLVEVAGGLGGGVEIDMEDHTATDRTLDIYRRALQKAPNTRVCLQAYLHRTADDLEQLIAIGGRIRLVKGAYREPAAVAFQKKCRVDEEMHRVVQRALSKDALDKGFHLALATHDEAVITAACQKVQADGLPRTALEFQFLYGVKGTLARKLVSEGYPVRLYLPYGSQWYPYFMRRLAERPANLLFMARNLFNN